MPTIDELQKQVFELYHAKQFAAISDLLTREIDVFPVDDRATYYSWQMCASALQGQTEQALAFFQASIDADNWYGEDALHKDPDLIALQGNAEFERLAAIALARSAKAQANAVPVLKVFPPKTGQESYPWLMMLHGNGSNLQPPNLDMLLKALQPASEQGWLIALPQSSQLRGKDRYVWDDIDWSVREVQHHLESLQKDYPVDTTHGIISGFSMGGGLALFMALTGAIPVYSVTVAAPWWGNSAELETAIATGKADHLRVSIIVSRHDVDCYRVSIAIETALKARGLPVTLIVTDDLDHSIPPGFHDLLATELQAAPRPV